MLNFGIGNWSFIRNLILEIGHSLGHKLSKNKKPAMSFIFELLQTAPYVFCPAQKRWICLHLQAIQTYRRCLRRGHTA